MIALWSGRETARWTVTHPQLLEDMAEEILREEAWWMAVRACKYASPATIWADRPRSAPATPSDSSCRSPRR